MQKKEVREKKVGEGVGGWLLRLLCADWGWVGVTTRSGSKGKEKGKGKDLNTRRGSRNQWDIKTHARDLGT